MVDHLDNGTCSAITHLESVLQRLLDDRGDSGHVLVRRVGAAANEAILNLERPAVLLSSRTLIIIRRTVRTALDKTSVIWKIRSKEFERKRSGAMATVLA